MHERGSSSVGSRAARLAPLLPLVFSLGCGHMVYDRYLQDGHLAFMREKYARAAWFYEKAAERADGLESPEEYLGMPLLLLAVSYLKTGHDEEAIATGKRAIPILEAHEGADGEKVLTCLLTLGHASSDLGRYEEAAGYYEHALKISERRYGRRDEGTEEIRADLAEARGKEGRSEEAEGAAPKAAPRPIKASVCDWYQPRMAVTGLMRFALDQVQCLVTAPFAAAGAEEAQSEQYALAPQLFFPLEYARENDPSGFLHASEPRSGYY